MSDEDKDKNWAAAVTEFNEAIKLNPQFVIAYEERAGTYGRLKKYVEAIADYSTVIANKPNDWGVYLSRGNLYSESGRDDEAIKDFDKAVQDKNDLVKTFALYGRGQVYFKKNEFSEAISDFTMAIQFYKVGLFYSARAEAYEKIGRKDLAEADRKKASK